MAQRPKTMLYQERQRKGWTQSQLAQKLNSLEEEGEAYGAATADMIRKWEKGIHTPSPFYRRRLCRLFNCTADQLGFALPEEMQTMGVPSTAPLPPRENIVAAKKSKRSWSDTMQQTFSLLQVNEQSDTTVEMLRTLLASMPEETAASGAVPLSRRQLLEIGIAALLIHLAQLDKQCLSLAERETLSRVLSESIKHQWKNLFSSENTLIVAFGQVTLTLIHQAHTLIHPLALPYLYAGAHSLIGIGLHFQKRDKDALQAFHHSYIASLATGNAWYVVQSLICQADSYHALGEYTTAIQAIEEALRIVTSSTDENEQMTRAKAHLFTCWADNAMMLHDDQTTQAKLEVARKYLDPIQPDEEFDQAAWLLIAGKHALHSGNYLTAKEHFEQALLALPKQWFLRRAMTSIGLAMAYARLGQKHASLTIAKESIPLLKQTNAPLTNQWFTNYLQQDLLATFHTDDEIQGFVVEECQQLSQQAHLFHRHS
jgi:transcriptional regulator with XRE-family HTH domain